MPPRIFPDGTSLWEAFQYYLADLDKNPLEHEVLFNTVNGIERVKARKNRAPSWAGFATFIGASQGVATYWKKHPDLAETCERIQDVLFARNYEGAAAGVLNPTIVGRYIGLAEKNEVSVAPPPEPIEVVDDLDIPNKVHPDAPPEDAYGDSPLLFSQRQLDAGVSYPRRPTE